MSETVDGRIQRLLARHQVDPAARLGGGMEADVYARHSDTVLKIHRDNCSYADRTVLKKLYEQLERAALPFAVPLIVNVDREEGCVVTIERRLTGQPMTALLRECADRRSLDTLMRASLDALVALSEVRAPPEFTRYQLLDRLHLSRRDAGDRNQFLTANVRHKAAAAFRAFERDVADFENKLQRLLKRLSARYTGDYRLLHGDFFPGKVLLVRGAVSAVLDFGMMTMYGGPSYDLATALALFDMYDALGMDAREALERHAPKNNTRQFASASRRRDGPATQGTKSSVGVRVRWRKTVPSRIRSSNATGTSRKIEEWQSFKRSVACQQRGREQSTTTETDIMPAVGRHPIWRSCGRM